MARKGSINDPHIFYNYFDGSNGPPQQQITSSVATGSQGSIGGIGIGIGGAGGNSVAITVSANGGSGGQGGIGGGANAHSDEDGLGNSQ